MCTYLGSEVPCATTAGIWSQARQCYLRLTVPQPPPSDPAWQGHDDGAVYGCYSPVDNFTAVSYLWLPESPAGIDQEALARRAVDSMRLRAIQIGLPVPDDDEHMIYVGAPVWLWAADPDLHTLGPQTASATAGGITVTATARLEGITWNMGDGTSVRCNGEHRARGTVYKPAYGMADSPTCGHRYQHPRKAATITATSRWAVEWNGPADSGTFTFDLARATTRRIGEIQVLINQS